MSGIEHREFFEIPTARAVRRVTHPVTLRCSWWLRVTFAAEWLMGGQGLAMAEVIRQQQEFVLLIQKLLEGSPGSVRRCRHSWKENGLAVTVAARR